MKFRIYLRSFNNIQLITTSQNIRKILEKENCFISSIIALPNHTRKFCVIRSPHIDKDSREQFQITTYKRFIDIETKFIENISIIFSTEIPAGVYCSFKLLL